MPKVKKDNIKELLEATKSDIVGFQGGMPVNLDKKGGELRDKLSHDIGAWLEQEIKNQQPRIEKLSEWSKLYRGQRKPKNLPHPNCFSRDTEVLSSTGWISVQDVQIGNYLYSMNPTDGKAIYSRVTAAIEEYADELLHIRSESMDFMVTNDHRMAVWVKGMEETCKFVRAEELNTTHKIPLTSNWVSGELATEIFGFCPFVFMEFLGWFLAEGWVFKTKTVGIAQSNEYHRGRIREVLDEMGVKYSVNDRSFLISAKSLPDELITLLQSLGKSDEKFIPRSLMNLDGEYLRSLLAGLIRGDGYVRFRFQGKLPEIMYGTTSRELANDVQEIAQKIGLRASIKIEDKRGTRITSCKKKINSGVTRKILYRVSILFKNKAAIKNSRITVADYRDAVYCFTVNPYNTVLVRRNGIAAWCGQCANVAIPITRINTEAIAVRVLDGLHNRPKVFIVEPKDTGDPQKNEMFKEIAPMLEEDLNWWAMDVVNLKKKLFSPTLQSIKTGTGVLKMWPVSRKRTVTRYAGDEEVDDPLVPTFKLEGGQDALKEVVTSYEGADIFPISREDFVMSSEAISIQEAFFIGFRTYHRKPDIQMKVRQGLYDEKQAERVKTPDELDETKKDRVEEQYKEVPAHLRDKMEIWELWFRYDVDDDGEEDDIVVTFHQDTNTILRCIYNPIFNGFRPFIDLIFNPVEFAFDGEGTCEILEKLQLQIDSLHNMYIDRLAQINSPILFIRAGEGIDIAKILPGMALETQADPEEVIKEFRFSDQTYTILPEEGRLVDYGNKAVGVTPDILGQPTADRPVFKEMLSRVQEANKKFKFGIDNYRDKISEAGMMYLEFSAQYQPVHTYYVKTLGKDGKPGQPERKTATYPIEYLRDGINVKVAASNELLNTEVRREIAMQRFALIREYNTDLAGMVRAMESPFVPASLKALLVKVSEIGEKELENVLRDMDTINPEDMVLKIADVVNIPQAMVMSGMQPPPEGGEGGQPPGAPPQGQPPQ